MHLFRHTGICCCSSLRGTKAIYETTQPQYREIKEEINISGNVFPMKEIEIKSQISGVLDKINVSIGDKVRIGDPVASIMLVPNASDMERLEYNLNTAQIEYKARLEDYKREHKLYSKTLWHRQRWTLTHRHTNYLRRSLPLPKIN